MRKGRMKGLYYDRQKRCHFYEVRVPQDVITLLGLKSGSKRKETFTQSVGPDDAEDRALQLLQDWKAEWNALRFRQEVNTPEYAAQLVGKLNHAAALVRLRNATARRIECEDRVAFLEFQRQRHAGEPAPLPIKLADG